MTDEDDDPSQSNHDNDGNASGGRRHVVIVGAGMAGLVCAHSLLEQSCRDEEEDDENDDHHHHPLDLHVTLIEASSQVGGRIQANYDFCPGFPLDVGAEYITMPTKNGASPAAPDEDDNNFSTADLLTQYIHEFQAMGLWLLDDDDDNHDNNPTNNNSNGNNGSNNNNKNNDNDDDPSNASDTTASDEDSIEDMRATITKQKNGIKTTMPLTSSPTSSRNHLTAQAQPPQLSPQSTSKQTNATTISNKGKNGYASPPMSPQTPSKHNQKKKLASSLAAVLSSPKGNSSKSKILFNTDDDASIVVFNASEHETKQKQEEQKQTETPASATTTTTTISQVVSPKNSPSTTATSKSSTQKTVRLQEGHGPHNHENKSSSQPPSPPPQSPQRVSPKQRQQKRNGSMKLKQDDDAEFNRLLQDIGASTLATTSPNNRHDNIEDPNNSNGSFSNNSWSNLNIPWQEENMGTVLMDHYHVDYVHPEEEEEDEEDSDDEEDKTKLLQEKPKDEPPKENLSTTKEEDEDDEDMATTTMDPLLYEEIFPTAAYTHSYYEDDHKSQDATTTTTTASSSSHVKDEEGTRISTRDGNYGMYYTNGKLVHHTDSTTVIPLARTMHRLFQEPSLNDMDELDPNISMEQAFMGPVAATTTTTAATNKNKVGTTAPVTSASSTYSAATAGLAPSLYKLSLASFGNAVGCTDFSDLSYSMMLLRRQQEQQQQQQQHLGNDSANDDKVKNKSNNNHQFLYRLIPPLGLYSVVEALLHLLLHDPRYKDRFTLRLNSPVTKIETTKVAASSNCSTSSCSSFAGDSSHHYKSIFNNNSTNHTNHSSNKLLSTSSCASFAGDSSHHKSNHHKKIEEEEDDNQSGIHHARARLLVKMQSNQKSVADQNQQAAGTRKQEEVLTADHVVVAVPPTIVPRIMPNLLPQVKLEALKYIGYTNICKVVLKFSQSFWPSQLQSIISGDCLMFPELSFRSHSIKNKQYHLVVFTLSAEYADEFIANCQLPSDNDDDDDNNSREDEDEEHPIRITPGGWKFWDKDLCVDLCVQHLAMVLSLSEDEIRKHFVDLLIHDWESHAWIECGQLYARVGMTGDHLDALAAPIVVIDNEEEFKKQQQRQHENENSSFCGGGGSSSIHFCGEATDTKANFSIQSAMETGHRAAHEVLEQIGIIENDEDEEQQEVLLHRLDVVVTEEQEEDVDDEDDDEKDGDQEKTGDQEHPNNADGRGDPEQKVKQQQATTVGEVMTPVVIFVGDVDDSLVRSQHSQHSAKEATTEIVPPAPPQVQEKDDGLLSHAEVGDDEVDLFDEEEYEEITEKDEDENEVVPDILDVVQEGEEGEEDETKHTEESTGKLYDKDNYHSEERKDNGEEEKKEGLESTPDVGALSANNSRSSTPAENDVFTDFVAKNIEDYDFGNSDDEASDNLVKDNGESGSQQDTDDYDGGESGSQHDTCDGDGDDMPNQGDHCLPSQETERDPNVFTDFVAKNIDDYDFGNSDDEASDNQVKDNGEIGSQQDTDDGDGDGDGGESGSQHDTGDGDGDDMPNQGDHCLPSQESERDPNPLCPISPETVKILIKQQMDVSRALAQQEEMAYTLVRALEQRQVEVSRALIDQEQTSLGMIQALENLARANQAYRTGPPLQVTSTEVTDDMESENEAEQQLEELRLEVESLTLEVEDRNAMIQARDVTIDGLEQHVSRLQTDVNQLNDFLECKEVQMQSLQAEMKIMKDMQQRALARAQEAERQAEQAKGEAREKDAHIQLLKLQLQQATLMANKKHPDSSGGMINKATYEPRPMPQRRRPSTDTWGTSPGRSHELKAAKAAREEKVKLMMHRLSDSAASTPRSPSRKLLSKDPGLQAALVSTVSLSKSNANTINSSVSSPTDLQKDFYKGVGGGGKNGAVESVDSTTTSSLTRSPTVSSGSRPQRNGGSPFPF
ncbi:hypothetical protein ACA910_010607 [Epithemia clementina (nom. ined.)]